MLVYASSTETNCSEGEEDSASDRTGEKAHDRADRAYDNEESRLEFFVIIRRILLGSSLEHSIVACKQSSSLFSSSAC